MTNLCQLRELGLSCIGCCGHDMVSKHDIEQGLKLNTFSFHDALDKEQWGRRQAKALRSCGICHNLIMEDKEIFCPLHPERNNGKDLRDSHCNRHHLCKTSFAYKRWDNKKRKLFISFLKSKKLDWHSYSVGMDTDRLLEEFEKQLTL